VEKQDVTFSRFVVEIRKNRKIKSRLLLFSKVDAVKICGTTCQALKKKTEIKSINPFDTFHI